MGMETKNGTLIVTPNLNVIKKAYLSGFFIILGLLLLFGGLFILDVALLKIYFFSALFVIPTVLLAGALIFQPIFAYLKYLHYKASKYTFYADKFEYYEGFFTQVKRILQYQYVTDISVRKSWLIDRIFNTGSVAIFTAGIGTWGLQIRYIDNPDKIVDYLQTLLKKYKK